MIQRNSKDETTDQRASQAQAVTNTFTTDNYLMKIWEPLLYLNLSSECNAGEA